MKLKKQIITIAMVAAAAIPAPAAVNKSKQNILSEESASKLQVKKIISGKQDALKRVSATYDFFADSIYDIYVTPDFVTMIKLDPEENIIDIKGGDNTNFEVEQTYGGEDNGIYLLIQPKDLDVSTNFTVFTDKRIYMFNLFSTLDVFNPQVKFNYPVKGNTSMSYNIKNRAATGKGSFTVDMSKIDSNYSISNKHLPFSPQQVYTDGTKTVITLPTTMQEAPVILVKGENSKNYEVVNFEYELNKIIVHRRIDEAILKVGKKQITIKRNSIK